MVLTDEEFSRLSCCERCSVRWKTFKKAVWNRETREFCGKNKEDWGKTLLAFTLFYGVFAAFYACCFAILARTLGNEAPLMIDMMTPIKNNPALNFDPRVIDGTTLIKVINGSNSKNTERMNSLYLAYSNYSKNARKCSPSEPVKRGEGTPCSFDTSEFGRQCTPNNFGYDDSKPCVMIKINKVFGWDPTDLICAVDDPDPACGPLEDFRKKYPRLITKHEQDKPSIPISCEGQNDGDKDNLLNVTFYPEYGIPSYYFPFFNQPNFQSPAIMAQFELMPGVAVMIWCRLWTRSIKHDMNDQQGSVRFEIIIDSPKNFTTYLNKN